MPLPEKNPFETPRPAGVRLVQGTLRVVVAMQCWGLALARLHLGQRDLLCELLGQARNVPVDQIEHLSNIVASALIVCGALTLLRPCWPVLLAVIIYQAGSSIAGLLEDQGATAMLIPALQATRCVAPLALLLIDFWPPRLKCTLVLCLSAVVLLRLAVGVTFAAQGLNCLEQAVHGGALVEFVQRAAEHGLRQTLSEDQARQALAVIGACSAALALSLLSGRSRSVGALAVLWGLGMAFSPTLVYSQSGTAESLMRTSEAGAPLAVLFFWIFAVRENRPTFLAEQAAKIESE